MSQENVELHRRTAALFNGRDIEGTIALSDPRIELHALPAPRGSVYRGHDGLREWHRDLEEAWEVISVEPWAYFDLGERTAAFNLLHARGRQSGAEVTMHSASVVQWRDGLAIYTKVYPTWEDALTDLGISAEALSTEQDAHADS
jgi:ketosteroid isomerase-like protein